MLHWFVVAILMRKNPYTRSPALVLLDIRPSHGKILRLQQRTLYICISLILPPTQHKPSSSRAFVSSSIVSINSCCCCWFWTCSCSCSHFCWYSLPCHSMLHLVYFLLTCFTIWFATAVLVKPLHLVDYKDSLCINNELLQKILRTKTEIHFLRSFFFQLNHSLCKCVYNIIAQEAMHCKN